MDVQQNLRQNDVVNQFKTKLQDLKNFKKQLEEAYSNKSTTFMQKNDTFFVIMYGGNEYKQALEEIQRIIDEDLVNVNAPNIPEDLIIRIDSDQSIKDYMQERKEQVKRKIEIQKEKQQNLNTLTKLLEDELISNNILPQQ